MSFSIGAMASGLAQGQDQVFADRRNRAADQRAQEQHDSSMQARQQLMDQREDDSQWASRVRQNQMGQWKQQEQEQQTQQQIRDAMLQAEVSGDVSGLVETYNSMTGGLIREFEPTENGYRFVGADGQETTMSREEVMGFGAALMQPGALAQVRQAIAQREAEAQNAQADRMNDWRISKLEEGEWGTDAEGNRQFRMPGDSYQQAPDMDAGRVPAEVTTNRYVAQILGMSEGEAFQFRQQLRNTPPEEAVNDIFNSMLRNEALSVQFMDDDGNVDLSGVMNAARDIYSQMRPQGSGFSISGGSGGGGNNAGSDSGPSGGGSRQIESRRGMSPDSPIEMTGNEDQPPKDGSYVRISGNPNIQDGLYQVSGNELIPVNK